MLLRYFIPHKDSIIYVSAQTRAGVCYWKSICTFLESHLLSEMKALQLSFFVVNEQW